MSPPSTLAPFYAGWENYQRLLTAAVAPLSPVELALQAAPTLRPVWHLTAHIVGARIGWFQGVLGVDQPDLSAYRRWTDAGNPARSASELVEGLDRSWRLIDESLTRWTPAMLADAFTTANGWRRSRQWVIWHVLEHDLHHGGELFLTLGLAGVATPDLSYRAQPNDATE